MPLDLPPSEDRAIVVIPRLREVHYTLHRHVHGCFGSLTHQGLFPVVLRLLGVRDL